MATAKNNDAATTEAVDKPLTKVTLLYNGATYTLEYTRDSVRVLEDQFDFSVDDVNKGKLSKLPDLFYVGFAMHHPNMRRSVSDEIFSQVEDKQGLLTVLMQLYANAIQSVFEEPEQGKVVTWKAS